MPLTKSREWVSWESLILCTDVEVRRARKACRNCDTPLVGRRTAYCSKVCERAFASNHFQGPAYAACTKRAERKCERCGTSERLEVNHIDPVRGGPRGVTCKNHQDNLELLCHPCHVLVTEEQFRLLKAASRLAQGVLV